MFYIYIYTQSHKLQKIIDLHQFYIFINEKQSDNKNNNAISIHTDDI